MKLRLLLALLFLGASYLGAAERPNIILIFVDDLGYGDLSCYGNESIKTPNIDQLASEGQRWTSFYASGPACVTSRTGLMSGRHSALLGEEPLSKDRSILLPAMLKRQGYATAILGKWHLAGYPKDFTQSPMHPLECGFDYHYGTPGSNDAPGPPKQTLEAFNNATSDTWKIPLIRGREVVEHPADQSLFTQRYTQEAVQWIEEKKDESFFLYLAHNMPHIPIFASKNFQGKSEAGVFGDVVQEIDWSVGEVRKAVKAAGIEDNTLIIFTSDNGPWTVFGPRHGGTAKPLRGEKGTTWEGGFRVPGIFHWPGKIKPGTVEGIAANLDLYATFATLTGAQSLPDEKPGWMSTDLTPTLLNGKPSPRTNWFYNPDVYRSGSFKIHRTTRQPTNPHTRARAPIASHDPPLLYNLDEDIGELNNIAGRHPEVVKRLLKELEAAK